MCMRATSTPCRCRCRADAPRSRVFSAGCARAERAIALYCAEPRNAASMEDVMGNRDKQRKEPKKPKQPKKPTPKA
jgi:hypothetical protein